MNEEYFEHPVLNEQEMADLKIQAGDYQFETVHAEQKVSKSGNKMLVLNLRVWDKNGKVHNMTDFLVSVETMSYKIKHFWESVGYTDRYNFKNKVSDYENRQGICRIAPQKNQLNGQTDNKIVDYIPSEKKSSINDLKELDLNDDLPF